MLSHAVPLYISFISIVSSLLSSSFSLFPFPFVIFFIHTVPFCSASSRLPIRLLVFPHYYNYSVSFPVLLILLSSPVLPLLSYLIIFISLTLTAPVSFVPRLPPFSFPHFPFSSRPLSACWSSLLILLPFLCFLTDPLPPCSHFPLLFPCLYLLVYFSLL